MVESKLLLHLVEKYGQKLVVFVQKPRQEHHIKNYKKNAKESGFLRMYVESIPALRRNCHARDQSKMALPMQMRHCTQRNWRIQEVHEQAEI